jgi:cell division septum initiation protein DivIVA
MGNNTKPQLIIDDVEYDIESLTDQQKILLDHVADLERKVASAKFNLDQLQVGRDAFLNMLKQALAEQPGKEVE